MKNKTGTLPFIKTSDKETMKLLTSEGFELINDENGIWTFINCTEKMSKINFEENKITYSNLLCI